MSLPTQIVRGILIQIEGGRLLLPNATISEVLSYSPPDPVASAPRWLLGRLRWRGWHLPLVSFSRMAGIADEGGDMRSKVIVLKALGEDVELPYYAMLTQGFPRLVTVSRDVLGIDAQHRELPDVVLSGVLLHGDAALLPDLAAIEAMIAAAVTPAAAPAQAEPA